MQAAEGGTSRSGQLIVPVAIAAISFHLVIASLFFIEAPLVERLAWAVLAGLAGGAAVLHAGGLSRGWYGMLTLAYGGPAVLFGLGVHASHIVQVGFRAGDLTGVVMLAAGLVLTGIGVTTLVGLVRTWRRRLLLVPLGVAVAFFVFPVGLAVFATNVAHVPCCDETPMERGIAYRDVTFETEQGRQISAWYIQPRNGAVVITVHGAGSNRATVMDEAEVLARHGYGVLMLDVEGYGDSEGRANAFGWAGARDVAAAIKHLKTYSEVDAGRIGGLGLSMGGEVLLQAAAENQDLTAIVAEGATGRTRDDFDENGGLGGVLIVPFWEVLETSIQFMTGESVPPPFTDLVPRIAPRSVLLISASIPEEEDLMGLYARIGGPSFESWTIPESKHVGAFDLHPEEYERRVIAFFDRTLLAEPGVAVR